MKALKASCVIVTRGDRPEELARAVASARAQQGGDLEILVVANGALWESPHPSVRVLSLPEDLGPPAARNAAVPETSGEVLFFLDDDAWYPFDTGTGTGGTGGSGGSGGTGGADPGVAPHPRVDLVARALRLFEEDPKLGIVSFRIVDPDGRPSQRRHVPRLRAGDPARSSDVTTFLEGACAIRRTVFDRAGPFPEAFFFGHEGTDLAWRALDEGFRVTYAGDLVVHHPSTPATRHRDFHYLTARNRIFLARRRLPGPLAALYCLNWIVLTLARARSLPAARDALRGFAAGLRHPCGPRRPIRWRTAWRMTRTGRPPII